MSAALLNRAARLLALATMLSTGVLSAAQAATFTAKRGINLDIWTTWPGRDKWGDAATLLPFPEWRKHVTADDLAKLKADGFDFVRMPVDPAPLLAPESEGLREQLVESVLESAHAINAAGLKVIVDLHLIGADDIGTMGSIMADADQFERYLGLVRAMGSALSREDPEKLALELMNEPVIDCDNGQSAWPERLRKLFAAARSSATKLTLVLSGGCYSSADQLAALDPHQIVDDNIIWTFHSYEPFLLTHQGASWAGDFIPYVTGIPYPPSLVPRAELDGALEAIRERMRKEAPLTRRAGLLSYLDEQIAEIDTDEKLKAAMDAPFDKVAAWAGKNGIKPENILLGEFGMITQDYGKPFVMPATWRAAYAKDVIARAEAKGFAWSIWGYGGSFGIVDAFDGKKAEPGVIDVVRGLPPR
jgi:endoglucanase